MRVGYHEIAPNTCVVFDDKVWRLIVTRQQQCRRIPWIRSNTIWKDLADFGNEIEWGQSKFSKKVDNSLDTKIGEFWSDAKKNLDKQTD